MVVAGDEVVGEGWHQEVGGLHAEVFALRAAGERARGATLYVTLEPCAHYGRTPPCAEAVIAAGIARVVACHRDPDPRVSGGGFERLRAAGIEVVSGMLAERAVELNWRFLIATTAGRPAVTLKWAMSLDGKIATATGESQWISSPRGRRWALAEREEHDALLAGIGTVLADDPRLDRRLGLAGKPNLRVVLDRRLRLPPSARLLTVPGEVLVFTSSTDRTARGALERRGATVLVLAEVEPAAVLAELGHRGVRSVLVEGGAAVAGAFAAAGLFDRVAVDCAPLLIGGKTAPGPLGGEGFSPLAAAPKLDRLRLERRGDDVILSGFRQGCLQGLCSSVAG